MSKPYIDELRDCPFCGKNDALTIETDRSADRSVYAYHVGCHHCGCRGRNNYPIGWCESPEAAIEAWNHRGSILPEIIHEADLLPVDIELIGAEVPDTVRFKVPKEWFHSHVIRLNTKATAIFTGIERR